MPRASRLCSYHREIGRFSDEWRLPWPFHRIRLVPMVVQQPSWVAETDACVIGSILPLWKEGTDTKARFSDRKQNIRLREEKPVSSWRPEGADGNKLFPPAPNPIRRPPKLSYRRPTSPRETSHR